MPQAVPKREIDSRTGRFLRLGRSFSIPYSEQRQWRVRQSCPHHGTTHRHLRSVLIGGVITEIGIVGCIANRMRPGKTPFKAIRPSRARWPHRVGDEVRSIKGKHDIQLGTALEERFGKQDVSAAGKRTEAAADVVFLPIGRE